MRTPLRALGAATGRADRGPAGAVGLLRGLLVSEYFILYLTVAYFAGDGGLLSRLSSLRATSATSSPTSGRFWPSPSARPSSSSSPASTCQPGRDHGLRQRRRRRRDGRPPPTGLLLGGSPLWGTLLDETGGLLAGEPPGCRPQPSAPCSRSACSSACSTASSSPASRCRPSW